MLGFRVAYLGLRVLQMLDEIRERLPEPFDMDDIRSRVAELSPYIMVAIQVGYHRQNPHFPREYP